MTTTRRDLRISGPFGDHPISIESFKGRESLSVPFEYEVTLLSTSPDLDLSKLIGEAVTATIDTEGGHERHFNGYVTKTALVDTFDRHARYRLTLRPSIWMMSPRINSRIFQNLSIPDIVKAMLGEHGFSEIEDLLSGPYPTREYVVQYGESDFAFVSRLMEQVGIYYFFKHAKDHHTIVLIDASSGHNAQEGYKSIPFDPTPLAQDKARRDRIRTWLVEQQLGSGAYASTDFDFRRPKASLLSKLGTETRPKEGHHEIFDYPGGFDSAAAGETRVRTRLQEARVETEVVTGGGDARGLGAGNIFDLVGHPMARQNKRYLVVSAAFVVSVNAHESGGAQQPLDFRVDFRAIEAKVQFRPARTTAIPRIDGVQTAIVVGPKGEEIHTDKYGRVKVQFHWDREGKRDENSSCWMRVAQIWAGSQWGAVHLPRIGQEVLIDFLEGDPDQPIIVGRVYNGDNMVPYELPGQKTKSGIKSRSSLGGTAGNFNELRFEDKKGTEEVFLQAEKDLEILVKHDEHRLVQHDRRKEVTNDEITTIGGNRTEAVAQNETITITGNRTESVAMNETIAIIANRTETVAMNETVMILGRRTHSVGKDESVSITGGRTLTVLKDDTTTVGGKQTLEVGKDQRLSITGGRTVTVGKSLMVDAVDEIVLKSGDASITLKKNGNITIKGKDIVLDGSGRIGVTAVGEVNLKGSQVTEN